MTSASTTDAGTDTVDAPAGSESDTAAEAAGRHGEAEGAPAKKAAPKKTKTLELTLTVTGTADGEWKAELKQGNSYIAKNLLVAAAAVSRAAKELHEDLSGPIDEVIDAAREQQAAKVAALEAELEAARKALAELPTTSPRDLPRRPPPPGPAVAPVSPSAPARESLHHRRPVAPELRRLPLHGAVLQGRSVAVLLLRSKPPEASGPQLAARRCLRSSGLVRFGSAWSTRS